ncbi:hypothetical protein HZH66_013679 [Vespula vulgaris]|uniref:Uncharacterized protein n=1 Tax=Vespula vulgaris TaxID=7454 RepID=A0A834MR32_VESVU|nr:hypothetical protein HZH66_013679 [Vespula vulgaris]
MLSILVKVHPADGTTLLGPIEYLNKQTVHKKGVEIALKYKIVQYFGHSSVITVALIEKQEQLEERGTSCKQWNLKISDTGKLEMEELKNILVTLLTRRFDLNSNIEIVHDIVSKLLKGYLSIPKISATSKRLFFMTRNIHLQSR